MKARPGREHRWLDQLVGDWTCETECRMGPDQPAVRSRGTEVVRSLGGLWIVAGGQGDLPCGGKALTLMTLGYDPRTERFTGTYIASMTTHLWVYNGALDPAGRMLTLEAEGPGLSGGKIARYQDTLELVDQDHRILRSHILNGESHGHGHGIPVLTAHYRRMT